MCPDSAWWWPKWVQFICVISHALIFKVAACVLFILRSAFSVLCCEHRMKNISTCWSSRWSKASWQLQEGFKTFVHQENKTWRTSRSWPVVFPTCFRGLYCFSVQHKLLKRRKGWSLQLALKLKYVRLIKREQGKPNLWTAAVGINPYFLPSICGLMQ